MGLVSGPNKREIAVTWSDTSGHPRTDKIWVNEKDVDKHVPSTTIYYNPSDPSDVGVDEGPMASNVWQIVFLVIGGVGFILVLGFLIAAIRKAKKKSSKSSMQASYRTYYGMVA